VKDKLTVAQLLPGYKLTKALFTWGCQLHCSDKWTITLLQIALYVLSVSFFFVVMLCDLTDGHQ
jgi:hypothetical protein